MGQDFVICRVYDVSSRSMSVSLASFEDPQSCGFGASERTCRVGTLIHCLYRDLEVVLLPPCCLQSAHAGFTSAQSAGQHQESISSTVEAWVRRCSGLGGSSNVLPDMGHCP